LPRGGSIEARRRASRPIPCLAVPLDAEAFLTERTTYPHGWHGCDLCGMAMKIDLNVRTLCDFCAYEREFKPQLPKHPLVIMPKFTEEPEVVLEVMPERPCRHCGFILLKQQKNYCSPECYRAGRAAIRLSTRREASTKTPGVAAARVADRAGAP